MARSINEIKAEICSAFLAQDVIRSAYGLDDSATFDKAFSPVSIESILFYVVASCIWVVESLFDRHKSEVEENIEALKPHTLRWYVAKTLDYMHNCKLITSNGVVVEDHYDTTGMTESEIEKKKVVKYAVATEENTLVYIKVAKNNANGRPTQLTAKELSGLEYYLSQIKDAGVSIRVLNVPADKMNVELFVLYDPSILNAEFLSSEDAGEEYRRIQLSPIDNADVDVVDETVRGVITNLPFNGEYRNSDLLAAVQAIEGIEVADITSVEASVGDNNAFSPVVGFRRPYSGYYALNNLVVRGRAYKVAE